MQGIAPRMRQLVPAIHIFVQVNRLRRGMKLANEVDEGWHFLPKCKPLLPLKVRFPEQHDSSSPFHCRGVRKVQHHNRRNQWGMFQKLFFEFFAAGRALSFSGRWWSFLLVDMGWDSLWQTLQHETLRCSARANVFHSTPNLGQGEDPSWQERTSTPTLAAPLRRELRKIEMCYSDCFGLSPLFG